MQTAAIWDGTTDQPKTALISMHLPRLSDAAARRKPALPD
jgi:hypothetical protein